MILVISAEHDLHAQAVMQYLSAMGHQVRILDLSQFPQRLQLSLRFGQNQYGDFRLAAPSLEEFPLGRCGAVWWRRPQNYEPDPDIINQDYRTFALAESYEALSGLWLALDSFWINHPSHDADAAHKVYQLKVAREAGLETPATLITNSPDDARTFVNRYGPERTIYKAFTATEHEWRETRVLRHDEVALLDNVRFAPVIFQELVPAEVDLRVTVVGEEIFPAAIYSQEMSYKVDYRMELNKVRIEAFRLPEGVNRGLRVLMDRLGLVYGAIDMRLTPDGRCVFLEINPAGQWLFVERCTGQPIALALARILAEHDRAE
jgi:hypothetical protein